MENLSNLFIFVVAAVLGYFCGAVPFGYMYVKKVKGIDLTKHESGRTGGTNSLRAAGVKVGIVTAISDVLKGFLSVFLTRLIFADHLAADVLPWVLITAGVFSVIGHNWSVFIAFRGGAGTGPNVGWASALWWPMFPIAALVMSSMMLGVGMASVASLAMAAIIPIMFIALYAAGVPGYSDTLAYIAGGLISLSVVSWSLRPNIKRLIAGNERVVGPRAKRIAKAKAATATKERVPE